MIHRGWLLLYTPRAVSFNILNFYLVKGREEHCYGLVLGHGRYSGIKNATSISSRQKCLVYQSKGADNNDSLPRPATNAQEETTIFVYARVIAIAVINHAYISEYKIKLRSHGEEVIDEVIMKQ